MPETVLDGLDPTQLAGQLNQRLKGWEAVRRKGNGFEVTDAFRAEVDRFGGLGALYGLFRADAWSGRTWETGVRPQERAELAALVQEEVRTRSGSAIGVLLCEEAPHGHQALGAGLLPVNLNVGAALDPELYRRAVEVVSRRLRADGAHLALVSALDVLRDPRWGRAEECYGEAPHLTAVLTTALVHGMQGQDRLLIHSGDGVGVVVKHFVAQGAAEGGRNGQSASIGQVELAEVHLPPAEAAIRAGAVGVMAAYGDVDGVPCCGSRALLTGLLRDRWDFDGIVMADGGAIDRLTEFGCSPVDAALRALDAGVDLSLWDHAYTLLPEVITRHELAARQARVAAGRVLRLKAAFGLLGSGSVASRTVPPVHEVVELSRRIAERSIVLTHHDGHALPLPVRVAGRRARWLLAGPFADDHTALLGDYVPPLAAEEARSIADALADRVDLLDSRSSTLGTPGVPDAVVCVLGCTSHRAYEDAFADNGALAAPGAAATCGEGADLADVRLPTEQVALVRDLRAATTAPLVLVVVGGRPQVLDPVADLADAVLVAGYPGPAGADAIADVLTGVLPPTGRLPATWPSASAALPARHDGRYDPAGVYLDVVRPVALPFGYGLSLDPLPPLHTSVSLNQDGVTVTVTADGPVPEGFPLLLFGRREGGALRPRDSELLAFTRWQGESVRFFVPSNEVFAEAVTDAAGHPVGKPRTRLWLGTGAGVEPVGHVSP